MLAKRLSNLAGYVSNRVAEGRGLTLEEADLVASQLSRAASDATWIERAAISPHAQLLSRPAPDVTAGSEAVVALDAMQIDVDAMRRAGLL